MATITKTVTENMFQGEGRATWTVTHTGSNITVTGNSFTFTTPTVTAKYVYSGRSYGFAYVYLQNFYIGGIEVPRTTGNGWAWAKGTVERLVAMSSGTAYTIPKVTSFDGVTYEAHTKTLQTSTFFNATNKTARSLNITASNWLPLLLSGTQASLPANGYNTGQTSSIGTLATVTLNAPPTFESTQVYFDTPYVYAGYTTASVDVSNISIKYGGDISSVAFTVGNQTVTGSGNGTLSIALTAGGTFTPTVKVTDSRGQVTTKALNTITVNAYVAPTVSFTVERTDNLGVPNDEGESAVITATFNYTDVVASLTTPTVVVTDQDNTVVTPTITWYANRELTTAISNWSNVASGATVYALLDNANHDQFNTQKSYQIALTPNDTESSGTAITQILGSAFYTVDFLAGGHGIAFGQACTDEGFFCNMDANFMQDVFLTLDTTSASGTDHDLYAAITALGWQSEVIV